MEFLDHDTSANSFIGRDETKFTSPVIVGDI